MKLQEFLQTLQNLWTAEFCFHDACNLSKNHYISKIFLAPKILCTVKRVLKNGKCVNILQI